MEAGDLGAANLTYSLTRPGKNLVTLVELLSMAPLASQDIRVPVIHWQIQSPAVLERSLDMSEGNAGVSERHLPICLPGQYLRHGKQ
jgi:hypothetical protein